MAFVAGHKTKIEYDNAAASLQNLSAYIDSIGGVDFPKQNLETTAFGNASVASITGLRNGHTMSVSGSWDATLHTHMIAVSALDTGVTQTFTVHPAGDASGTPSYSVETHLTNYQISSSVGDKVTWSAELQVTGNVTTATN